MKLQMTPKFPARVVAGPGITIAYANGVFTISTGSATPFRLIASSASITLSSSDVEVGIDTRSTAVALLLPVSATWLAANPGGLDLTILDYYGNSAANHITPSLNGGDFFVGSVTPTVSTNFGFLKLRPVPGGWYVRA